MDKVSPTYKHGWLPSLVPFWRRPLLPNIPVIIELTIFSETLRQHEFGYLLRGRNVQLTTCALCAHRGPRLVPVVMLGLNVSGNLPNRTCDNGQS